MSTENPYRWHSGAGRCAACGVEAVVNWFATVHPDPVRNDSSPRLCTRCAKKAFVALMEELPANIRKAFAVLAEVEARAKSYRMLAEGVENAPTIGEKAAEWADLLAEILAKGEEA